MRFFVGDVIVLRTGDMVPVDCKILEGSLEVDLSKLNGILQYINTANIPQGTYVDIAIVKRARTQKLRRVRGKVWWAKRRRKIVRRDNGKVVEFEEV